MKKNSNVKAWKEEVILPTYPIGPPEKYPMFFEKRVYQGSSGAVYPHPIVETITDEKKDVAWEAVYIENDYLKIMILPALGGRIQMAFDKIRERHIVYYNDVIKPALVGLKGPWISGGIEFNWPQHHRPSTYEEVDFLIEENSDGSATVWVNEVERMFRTKGMAGFTLYPDKAYLEIKGRLYNRTPQPQTFLWWANPAVAVNEHYQSVFPPDVHAVFDHGKRDVSEFPIARGHYYKADYTKGVDISRYKNIPVPTSYMSVNSDYDFVGGYENDTQGGLLHVADHHVSPGKKQWTWGNGDFGKSWDRNLTDTGGPYIELMCGMYTDNQPDFSWLQPYEQKSFEQYFMPYYKVGVVKNATKEALVNLELENNVAQIKVYVTSDYPSCNVRLYSDTKTYHSEQVDLNPTDVYEATVQLDNSEISKLTVLVEDDKGSELIGWSLEPKVNKPLPEAAKPAKNPKEIESVEQLYLTGQHLEQYRHATYKAIDFYKEGLKRDPKDSRCNNAMGLLHLKRARFQIALEYFDAAIQTLTERNPNPYDSEAYFNKGTTLKYVGEYDEAYNAFYKSCWNAAWQDSGYFNLAQIDCMRKNYSKALQLLDRSLVRNQHNHKARHLKILLLRKIGRNDEALDYIEASLKIDPFNFGALYERFLLRKDFSLLTAFKTLMRDAPHNYLEYAIDYAECGCFEEASSILKHHVSEKDQAYPMVYYFLGFYAGKLKKEAVVREYFEKAQSMPSAYCFPNRLEEVVVLNNVVERNPEDAKAQYYLGNFWYAARQYELARTAWEESVRLDDTFPIALRNLALVYYNKFDKKTESETLLEKALKLNNDNGRLIMELDQFYKKVKKPIAMRYAFLEDHWETANKRDDLYLEWVGLHNQSGNHDKALGLLMNRKFHPWEGGEGKVSLQYTLAHLSLAKKLLATENYEKALEHLESLEKFPENLGEGKLSTIYENDVMYWKACALKGLGSNEMAKDYWLLATKGLEDPYPAFFYNDEQPDQIFYRGLSKLQLGQKAEAEKLFKKLLDYGNAHINDEVKIDYFAVSLPDLMIWDEDLKVRNQLLCTYLMALGKLGLKDFDGARELLENVLQRDCYHVGANIHLKLIALFELDTMAKFGPKANV